MINIQAQRSNMELFLPLPAETVERIGYRFSTFFGYRRWSLKWNDCAGRGGRGGVEK
ncbi:hypothetical protein [Corynebacterium mustelae]|uniref:hypothetical protein n=1 Tax=Corynebacterium mustelae TaxID=571915 RepID=UPI00130ED2D9|nr:hypothetical protein [Corynebacterium mustelae]